MRLPFGGRHIRSKSEFAARWTGNPIGTLIRLMSENPARGLVRASQRAGDLDFRCLSPRVALLKSGVALSIDFITLPRFALCGRLAAFQ